MTCLHKQNMGANEFFFKAIQLNEQKFNLRDGMLLWKVSLFPIKSSLHQQLTTNILNTHNYCQEKGEMVSITQTSSTVNCLCLISRLQVSWEKN